MIHTATQSLFALAVVHMREPKHHVRGTDHANGHTACNFPHTHTLFATDTRLLTGQLIVNRRIYALDDDKKITGFCIEH